jgi:CDP-paratose 2-epimerase
VSAALVTGAGGLIGSEAVAFLAGKGFDVLGIDNDTRGKLFGPEASTAWRLEQLAAAHPSFRNVALDIRDFEALSARVGDLGQNLSLVIHAAAQPSHDWAAHDPLTDFGINARGTLNLLEAVRRHAPHATFVFTSTNKVYGDLANGLPLVEKETRWELDPHHPFAARGIDESMGIDASTHSLFGVSKASADLMVQEYGRYFGLNTACFRGGCLTGGGHSGTESHGFLAYLMKCTVTGRPYTVFGYNGKQVRDNIHASDFIAAVWAFAQNPAPGRVYNIGGGRFANCSMLEAIALCEEAAGRKLDWTYRDEPRIGDHIWWLSDMSRFLADHPGYRLTKDLDAIVKDIYDQGRKRWGEN